jgi:hypothetical protein
VFLNKTGRFTAAGLEDALVTAAVAVFATGNATRRCSTPWRASSAAIRCGCSNGTSVSASPWMKNVGG